MPLLTADRVQATLKRGDRFRMDEDVPPRFKPGDGDARGKVPQHLYSVRFTAPELWGPATSPRDSIHIDLWDAHLDPA